jgi:hypothetical protein
LVSGYLDPSLDTMFLSGIASSLKKTHPPNVTMIKTTGTNRPSRIGTNMPNLKTNMASKTAVNTPSTATITDKMTPLRKEISESFRQEGHL